MLNASAPTVLAMRPDRGMPRLARTLVFTLTALGLAVGGHAGGGGGVPQPVVYLLVGPIIALLSLWLSGRQRGVWALLTVLVPLQAGLHVLFHTAHASTSPGLVSVSHHPPMSLPAPNWGTPLTADQHLFTGASDASALAGMHDSAGMLPSPAMVFGHLVAIALTAWVMAKGEQALWRVTHRLRVRLDPGIPSMAPLPTMTPVAADLRLRASRWAGRVVATRGPPVLNSA